MVLLPPHGSRTTRILFKGEPMQLLRTWLPRSSCHFVKLASAVLVACITLASCGGSSSADGVTQIDFRTDIFFNGGHLPLIAGIEEGIYEKHGLEVKAQEGTGSGTT